MNKKIFGIIGVIWALSGLLILLLSAIYRLYPHAAALEQVDLTKGQWLILGLFTFFMLMSEGFRGFHKQLSPRFASRTRFLLHHPTFLRVSLAPLFSMGYFQAPRRVKITATSITIIMILLIIFVRMIAQPWRGIIDFGVIAGLVLGIISIIGITTAALLGKELNDSEYIPEV